MFHTIFSYSLIIATTSVHFFLSLSAGSYDLWKSCVHTLTDDVSLPRPTFRQHFTDLQHSITVHWKCLNLLHWTVFRKRSTWIIKSRCLALTSKGESGKTKTCSLPVYSSPLKQNNYTKEPKQGYCVGLEAGEGLCGEKRAKLAVPARHGSAAQTRRTIWAKKSDLPPFAEVSCGYY